MSDPDNSHASNPSAPHVEQRGATPDKQWNMKATVIGLFFCCWPVALILMWTGNLWSRRTRWIITAIPAILFLVGVVLLGVSQNAAVDGISDVPGSPEKSTAGRERGDEDEARSRCTIAVERRLSPKNADFPWTETPVAVSVERGTWVVTGRVDTQNAFGAPVRAMYVCTLEYVERRYVEKAINIVQM